MHTRVTICLFCLSRYFESRSNTGTRCVCIYALENADSILRYIEKSSRALQRFIARLVSNIKLSEYELNLDASVGTINYQSSRKTAHFVSRQLVLRE